MKIKLFKLLIIFLTVILYVGCGGATSSEISDTASIKVKIYDINSIPIEDVTIDVYDENEVLIETAISSSSGVYIVTKNIDTNFVLLFKKDDFATQLIPVRIPNKKDFELSKDIIMVKRGIKQSYNIENPGTISAIDGASVKVLANSFVDTEGNIASGNIDISITPIDVSNSQEVKLFPGKFKGINLLTQESTEITSLGTVEYHFTQNGEQLQLADGMTATIQLPLYITTHPVTKENFKVSDSIELWSLNEKTGLWIREGNGIVVVNNSSPTGYALEATVSHFTWWNIDVPFEPADVEITLNGDENGTFSILHSRSDDFNGWLLDATSYLRVGAINNSFPIPTSSRICFWIEYQALNQTTALSQEQCITNVLQGITYPLTFTIANSDALTLSNNWYDSYYLLNDPISILLMPISLESSVTYTITSGTLPLGVSLQQISPTGARIIGSSNITGTYNLDITGTDNQGNIDTRNISFQVDNPPAPYLQNSVNLYAQTNSSINTDLSTYLRLGPETPTSWTITNEDGTSIGNNGPTISNTGIVNLSSFNGVTSNYIVNAYNSNGVSNQMTLIIQKPTVIVLPTENTFIVIMGEELNENLTGYIISGDTATSWTITNQDGSQVSSSISISNNGIFHIDAYAPYPNIYKIQAHNTLGSSNIMSIYVEETMPMPIQP